MWEKIHLLFLSLYIININLCIYTVKSTCTKSLKGSYNLQCFVLKRHPDKQHFPAPVGTTWKNWSGHSVCGLSIFSRTTTNCCIMSFAHFFSPFSRWQWSFTIEITLVITKRQYTLKTKLSKGGSNLVHNKFHVRSKSLWHFLLFFDIVSQLNCSSSLHKGKSLKQMTQKLSLWSNFHDWNK